MTRMRRIYTIVFTSFIAQIPYLFMFGKKNTKIGVKTKIFNSLESTGDNGRQPPLLPPRLRATRVDTIIHNYRLSAAP